MAQNTFTVFNLFNGSDCKLQRKQQSKEKRKENSDQLLENSNTFVYNGLPD